MILDLKGFLTNQKSFLSTSEYLYYFQERKWNVTCQISEIAIIILSLKFIGSFEVAVFSFTNLFFRVAALVCFIVVIPFVAFPILLQQLQEKNEQQKNFLRFERICETLD